MANPPADRIFFGGDVVTMDQHDTTAEAVVVAGGRVAAVGKRDDVMVLAGPQTVLTDLAGRTLLPGLIDAHGHLGGTADKLASANLSPHPVGAVASMSDLQRQFREHMQMNDIRPGEWVVGIGYDNTSMEEGRHPTRDDLDAVSTEHPVVAVHISGHLLGVNTLALELAGISAETADPPGGHVHRGSNGKPNGVFDETAMALIYSRVPQPAPERAEEELLAACRLYASHGATTAQEAALYQPSLASACRALDSKNRLPLDVVAYPLLIYARAMLASPGEPARRFRFGGMKLQTDGSIQGYTAYLSRPYHIQRDGDDGYAGFPVFETQERLNTLVADGYENNWQVQAHANGDAAIDMVIEAATAAEQAYTGAERRTTIIHAQTIREDQLDEVARLGLCLSFFPGRVYYWGDRHRDIFLGPERAARIDPMRSALDRGIPITLHHDSPVTPPDILTVVWAAVNRATSGGQELGPDQRLTPREALRAVTIDAARQLFEEDLKGSIEVGKLADLVVLSANPLTVEPMAIRNIVVDETVKEGETIYENALR